MIGFQLLGAGVHRPYPDHYITSGKVHVHGDNYLVNIPENTQVLLQQYKAGMSFDAILLTDSRATNLLGLPGFLSTLTHIESREDEDLSDLHLYAPDGGEGTQNRIEKFVELSSHNCDISINLVEEGDIFFESDDYQIESFPTNGPPNSQGYVFHEATRKGRFDREKAEHELGIPPGKEYGRLHEGEAVELDDGRVIQPEQVVGPNRPGRSIAFTGDTGVYDRIPDAIRDIDVLFCDGGRIVDSEAKGAEKHMNAYQAGTIAGAAGVEAIVVTHVLPEHRHNPEPILDQVSEAHDGISIVGRSGMSGQIIGKEAGDGRRTRVKALLSDFDYPQWSRDA